LSIEFLLFGCNMWQRSLLFLPLFRCCIHSGPCMTMSTISPSLDYQSQNFHFGRWIVSS
jgi:hypothetical protein